MKLHRVLLGTALLVVTFCAAAWAQDTGSITGTVRDNTGAVVPKAEVTLTDTATKTSLKTNTNDSAGSIFSRRCPQGPTIFDLGRGFQYI